MSPHSLVPVILCGGTGTRLWPLSRATYPKQYWALASSGEETLLQQTQQRLRGLTRLAPPLLVCNEEHRYWGLLFIRGVERLVIQIQQ